VPIPLTSRAGRLRGNGLGSSNWSVAKLDPTRKAQTLDLPPLASGRGRILAETLRQRGNREVTNKQLVTVLYALFPASA
jgi:hypothetical protein